MYTYVCQILVLLPTFLFVQSTLRRNTKCSDTGSPPGHTHSVEVFTYKRVGPTMDETIEGLQYIYI